MNRFKCTLISLFIVSTLGFSEKNPTRINSNEDKISAIDEQIREFEMKKETLEKLKESFQKKDIDLKNGTPLTSRPKIGLVLSGGGAKGAAHIGVLRTLEKYKIPIDYIVGTSAGSIIAGMYSIGYTPDEIETTINSLNFGKLFTNTTDRDLKGIVEKATANRYPLTLSIDKKFNLSLPMGVFDGEQIYLQLKEIFKKAEGTSNFADLPIPYRAMATDLSNGTSVAIDSGDMALATLKSMAIPTFIDPIKDGSTYYVDGGVADNFPVLQAVEMGADIVIGVDISSDSSSITDSSNIVSILDKLSTYNGNVNIQRQKSFPDILITPDVKNHSTLDFSNLHLLIEEGSIAAEKLDFALVKLSDEKRFLEIKESSKNLNPTYQEIKNIKLSGSEVLTTEDVFNLRPKAGALTQEEIKVWIQKIYSLKHIDRVFYHVDGDTMEIIVREKINNKLNAGISYASNYGAGLEIAAEIPVLEKLGFSEKNYIVKTELSKYPKITIKDITQYKLLNNSVIGSADITYGKNPIFLYNKSNNLSTYSSNELEANVSIGKSLYKNSIFGYTLGAKTIDIDHESGLKLDKLPSFKNHGSLINNQLSFYYDSINKEYYPTKGTRIIGQVFSGTPTNGDSSYTGYLAQGSLYLPIKDKLSLSTDLVRGSIDGAENAPLADVFSVGGLRNNIQRRNYAFYGVPLGAIYTDNFIIASGALQYNIFSSFNLIGKYNILSYDQESIFGGDKKMWEDSLAGYGLGLGWDTFLGPIDLVLSNDALSNGYLFQVHIGYNF
ncbi:MAG: patatin-like phospholipase family protein [Fusobacteriaceae bacterium]